MSTDTETHGQILDGEREPKLEISFRSLPWELGEPYGRGKEELQESEGVHENTESTKKAPLGLRETEQS